MIKKGAWLTLLFLFILAGDEVLAVSEVFPGQKPDQLARNDGMETYGKIPLSFIENQGQFPESIQFYTQGLAHRAYFTSHGLSLFLGNTPSSQNMEIKFFPLNAQRNLRVVPEARQRGRVSYFYGNDPENWREDISSYRSVFYPEIYPGIDMRFYGNHGQLAYDVIVGPGADPSSVQFAYEGIEALKLAEDGALEILTKQGKLIQRPPYVYQEVAGRRVEVSSRFQVLGPLSDDRPQAYRYGFELGDYDHSLPLIIDPTLDYSTFLGGSNNDFGWAIALDSAGNAYVAGETWSNDFPTQSPIQGSHPGGTRSAFVAKIDLASSSLVYATYLGGSGDDMAFDIAVDSAGFAYVTGQSNSSDFPTVVPIQGSNGGGWDVFLTKLNPSGSVLDYSTYLGGNGNDFGRSIALDAAGGVYLTGETLSVNFPTALPIQANLAGGSDAFVTKINSSGTFLDYSTFLGGSVNGVLGDDLGAGIAVDAAGMAYVTGRTNTMDFPTVSPIQANNGGGFDVFVTKVNAVGSAWVYSSYLGGSQNEGAFALAVDASGNAYITGETTSLDFPTVLPIQASKDGGADVFVAKLNAVGSALDYATYLGGFRDDVAQDITLDAANNVYITGWTNSSDFPTLAPLQANLAGSFSGIALKLNAAGTALIYSSYLGAGGSQVGAGIAVDSAGASHITGWTDSSKFPTVNPLQGTFGGGSRDGFLLKISDTAPGPDITVSDSLVPISDFLLPFGGVTIGTSTQQGVTISNDGSAALLLGTLASGNTLAAPFSLISDGCSGQTLAPASQCTVDVRFAPTATTAQNDSFDIPSNDPDESVVTFNVSGTGLPLPAPDLSVFDNIAPISDLQIPFGSQTQGTFSDQTVTLLNNGNADLKVGTIAQADPLSAPFSLQNDLCSGQRIIPSSQCSFVIRFSPTGLVNESDSFDIPSDDPDESSVTVSLSGQGVVPLLPDLEVSDSLSPAFDLNLPFGDITAGNTTTQNVWIRNAGNADLRVGTFSKLAAPFQITENACAGQTLLPTETCRLTLRFSPLTLTISNASFNIFSNDPDENPLTVNLSGTGLGAAENQPPSEPQLRFPANAQENVPTAFAFEWLPVTDPDGDVVTEDLYFCEDPNPLNCGAIQVVSLMNTKNRPMMGLGLGVFVFGMIFVGRMAENEKRTERSKRFALLIVVLMGTFLISCSSGGGGAASSPANRLHEVNNLQANTQYFWTVLAKDGKGGVSQSDVWTFTTQ